MTLDPASSNPADTEPLARYLLSTSQFSVANRRVKPSAFMPPADGTLSVFVVSGLSEDVVWDLGRTEVGDPQGKPIQGRADVVVGVVRNPGLRLDVDNAPLRHANVIDWPPEKSEQKLKAEILAEEALLRIRP